MRVLVIRPGAVGDTLLAFPVIAALRASLPAAHVMLVGNRAVLPLALVCGLAEEVADFEEPRWSALFATHPDLDSALYRALGQIERAIAWLHDPEGLVQRNLQAAGIPQVTVAPGRPSAWQHIHCTEYLAGIVGVSPDPRPCYADCFAEMSEDKPLWQYTLVIHPGSGGAHKCWPPERFAAVIRALWRREQPILLLCGPADHERLDVLLQLLPYQPRSTLLRVLVDVPLRDLAPILRLCRGYLGNDAGMTHLAALLGLPTLALFGPSDPLTWRPRGRAVEIIHEPDLAHLEVDVVMRRLDSFFYMEDTI